MSTKIFLFFSYKVLTNAHNSSIIILERKESDNMKKQDIIKIIDNVVVDAIREYGFEAKKTLIIAENAEKIKAKILEKNIKVY